MKKLYVCFIFLSLSSTLLSFQTKQIEDSLKILNKAIRLVDTLDLSTDLMFSNTKFGAKIHNQLARQSVGYLPHFLFVRNKQLSLYPKLDYNKYLNIARLKPFTQVFFITGFNREEQVFKIFHFQQLGKLLTAGFEYRRNYFDGIYRSQRFQMSMFKLFFDFKTSSEFFTSKLIFNYYRKVQREQFGLKNIQDFENNVITNRQVYTPILSNTNSEDKKSDFTLNSQLKIDSNFTIVHRLDLGGVSINYTDQDPKASIYKNVFYDSTAYYFQRENLYLNNKFSLNLNIFDIQSTLFSKVNFNRYSQTNSYNKLLYLDKFSIGTNLQKQIKKYGINFKINVDYNLIGYQSENAELKSSITKFFSNKSSLNLDIYYVSQTPSLFNNQYYGNHYRWDFIRNITDNQRVISSSLKKISESRVQLNYKNDKINTLVSVAIRGLNNFIYYTPDLDLKQSKHLFLGGVYIKKENRIGAFNFDSKFNFQYSTENNIMPLPVFSIEQYITYQKSILKHSLPIKLGVRIVYNTEFYGYGYAPLLRAYYTQYQKRIGNYPFIDFFMMIKIRRAQLFMKYTHANAGWFGYRYFNTPNQPFLDAIFSFGLVWNMLN